MTPADRMRRFLREWKSLNHSSDLASRVQRLSRWLPAFADRIAILDAPKQLQAATNSIQLPNNLPAFIADIRRCVAQSMIEGDFMDIWAVAGIGRNEVRNAAVLAWLLHPRGSHGQGNALLRDFLHVAGLVLPDSTLSLANVRTEHRPLGHDRDRVDITVELPSVMVFVEVKIDAPEGDRQLDRYLESAAAKASALARALGTAVEPRLVFLSPRPPRVPHAEVSHVSWRQVRSLLRRACLSASPTARLIIDSFADHVNSFRGQLNAVE